MAKDVDITTTASVAPNLVEFTAGMTKTYRDWIAEEVANAPQPSISMLLRKITPADVKAYPLYFIVGHGRDIAGKTRCAHNYFLTDSCPGCDADGEV